MAQAVVDQVVRLHHERLELLQVRASTTEDITLLIREFGPCINMESKTLTHNSSRFISINLSKYLYDVSFFSLPYLQKDNLTKRF